VGAEILAYLAIGSVSGFLAGLLGIGGGVVLVPAFLVAFGAAGFPREVMFQVALATSMATILFTAVSSLRSHHRRGAVRWPIVATFTPGILLGAALGTVIASRASITGLSIFFGLFLLFVAAQLGLQLRPKAERELPGPIGQAVAATIIGMISALAAIGGGAITVPFLAWCNVPIRHAIGTASAVGFPIALGGTLGYIVNGWGVPGVPDNSLGFVYLPALLWTAIAAVLLAPLGARAAHVLPGVILRRVFAVLLVIIAIKMLSSAVG
jgi:uncharacterized membrane protein YfcA